MCCSRSPTATSPAAVDIIRRLDQLGYGLVATEGTARFIRELGFRARTVAKMRAGTPNVEQFIRSGSSVLVVNTLTGRRQALQDGHYMRRAAAETRTPCLTTLETVRSLLEALETPRAASFDVRTIDEYRGAPTASA